MASLQETIKTSSGGLADVTHEEMTSTLGMAAPISPFGAKRAGASPHQAKMAGVKDQKARSLRASIQGEMNLRDAERTGDQARMARVQAQQQYQDPGVGQFEALMGLEAAIQGLAQDRIEQAATAAKPTIDVDALSEAAAELGMPVEHLSAAVETLVSDPDATLTGAQLEVFRQALDLDPGQVPTAQQIQDEFVTTPAENFVMENYTFEDIVGYDPELKAALEELGIDLMGRNIAQIVEMVSAKGAESFNTTNELAALINSVPVGSSEYYEYMQMAGDFSSVSGEAAEQQFRDIEAAVRDDTGKIITLGGKPYSLEELLSDEGATLLAADYLNNEAMAAQIKKESPEFAALLDKNRELFEQLTANIDTSLSDVQKVVEANDKMQILDGRITMSEELQDLVLGEGFDPNSFTAYEIPEEKQQFYDMVNNPKKYGIKPEELDRLVKDLELLTGMNPELAKAVMDMSLIELQTNRAFTGGLEDLVTSAQATVALEQSANAGTPKGDEEFWFTVFGDTIPDGTKAADYVADLQNTFNKYEILGATIPPKFKALMDMMTGTPAEVLEKLKAAGYYGEASIDRLVEAGKDFAAELDAWVKKGTEGVGIMIDSMQHAVFQYMAPDGTMSGHAINMMFTNRQYPEGEAGLLQMEQDLAYVSSISDKINFDTGSGNTTQDGINHIQARINNIAHTAAKDKLATVLNPDIYQRVQDALARGEAPAHADRVHLQEVLNFYYDLEPGLEGGSEAAKRFYWHVFGSVGNVLASANATATAQTSRVVQGAAPTGSLAVESGAPTISQAEIDDAQSRKPTDVDQAAVDTALDAANQSVGAPAGSGGTTTGTGKGPSRHDEGVSDAIKFATIAGGNR